MSQLEINDRLTYDRSISNPTTQKHPGEALSFPTRLRLSSSFKSTADSGQNQQEGLSYNKWPGLGSIFNSEILLFCPVILGGQEKPAEPRRVTKPQEGVLPESLFYQTTTAFPLHEKLGQVGKRQEGLLWDSVFVSPQNSLLNP